MNRTIIRLLNKLQLLQNINVSGSVTVSGKRFVIPIIHKTGFDHLFQAEPWMVEVLQIVLQIQPGKFVDVGTNIGQTLLNLRSVSDQMPYIGFEPNPLCVFYMNQLISANKIQNAYVFPFGISSKAGIGELNFYYESDTDSSASTLPDFRPDQPVVRREQIVLFDIPAVSDKIDFSDLAVIKIDVEGSEHEVITGFRNEIARWNPILLIEILPAYDVSRTDRVRNQHEIVRMLREFDYSIFRIIKRDQVLIDFEEIPEIEIHSDLNSCEYVMVPATKRIRFKEAYRKVIP